MPFIAVNTTVSAASIACTAGATAAIAGAFTATITMSRGPTSRASVATMAGAASRSPPLSIRHPCRRNASAVAPRASAVTSAPARARRVPR